MDDNIGVLVPIVTTKNLDQLTDMPLPKGFCMKQYAILSNQGDRLHPHLDDMAKKHMDHEYQRPFHAVSVDAFKRFYAYALKLDRPIILDAGCGTGVSTVHLARLYPDHLVVGVDRSLSRLSKSSFSFEAGEDDLHKRVYFLRADLVDVYQMLLIDPLPIEKHYLFYPNPYPKAKHMKRRWHGHPIFPQLLQIAPYHELRSNWLLYLKECAYVVAIIEPKTACSLDVLSKHKAAISRFEHKYQQCNAPCYRLSLRRMVI